MSTAPPSSTPRRRSVRSLLSSGPAWAVGAVAMLGVASLARIMSRQFFVDGDTADLLRCADGVRACLAAGRWSSCPEAGKWPLLQYGPALLTRWLGGSLEDAGQVLCALSLGAFFGLLAMTWGTLRPRSRPVALAAVLVLASGVLFHYATRSFGEMLAGFLAAAFAAAWLGHRGPGLLAVLAFALGLTKETAFPFIALLGVSCAAVHRGPGQSWREWLRAERGRLVGGATGVALSVGASVLFNLWRFGTPHNARYFMEARWAPPLSVQLEHLAALWVAPNAGLLFFWPALVGLLVALGVRLALRGRDAADVPSWGPLVGVGLVVGGTCLVLSRWWAPYGWWAWGPRLVLPWLPAVLLVLLYAHAGTAEALVRAAVATPVRAALLAAVLVGVAMPHLVSIHRSNELLNALFYDRGLCPGPDLPETAPAYWRCLRAEAWEYPSTLVHAWRMVPSTDWARRAWWYPVLLVLGCAWLWHSTRHETASVSRKE